MRRRRDGITVPVKNPAVGAQNALNLQRTVRFKQCDKFTTCHTM